MVLTFQFCVFQQIKPLSNCRAWNNLVSDFRLLISLGVISYWMRFRHVFLAIVIGEWEVYGAHCQVIRKKVWYLVTLSVSITCPRWASSTGSVGTPVLFLYKIYLWHISPYTQATHQQPIKQEIKLERKNMYSSNKVSYIIPGTEFQ